MIKKLSAILGLILAVGAVYAGARGVESRYALNRDLKLVEYRLNQKILQDEYKFIQRRIWALEDRYKSPRDMPPEIRRQYRDLKLRLQQLERKMKGK